MSLFTKPINDVELNDIFSFCRDEIRTGIHVEYREFWPDIKILAREMASFANTHGGLLLIGIHSEQGKPLAPFPGVDFDEGLEEKITAIAFKSINPPMFPEIKICPLHDRPNRAVVVIRMQESNDTPHRVEENTNVYIRVSNEDEPLLAPFEEIEWLMNRRQKGVDNGNRIAARADKRVFEKYKVARHETIDTDLHAHTHPPEYAAPPTRGISIIPIYAHEEIVTYHKLKGLIDQSTTPYFPDYRSYRNDTSLQDSIIYSKDDGTVCHTEINSYGLVYHREDFSLDERNHLEEKDVIDIHLTLQMIYAVLSFAARFYETIGFWGAISIRVTFDQILHKKLFSESLSGKFIKNEYDNEIGIERKTTVPLLMEKVDNMVIDIYREIFWSLGAQEIAASPNLNSILEKAKSSLV